VQANPGGASTDIAAGVRPLFSYKRYTEQEALSLPADEIAAVVALTLGPAAAGGFVPDADAAAAAVDAAAEAGTRLGTAAAVTQVRHHVNELQAMSCSW
jgi:hypothetical protein